MSACKICSQPRPAGYSDTCGDSHCQEASYYQNKARNTRKPADRKAALDKAAACQEKALQRC